MNEELLNQARQAVEAAQRIVVTTGAGISAESGLDTFRGVGGIWEGVRAEELASPQGFRANPKRVWAWYNARRQAARLAEPNAAHLALAAAEQHYRLVLITQNVDRLHTRAGTTAPLELHGNLWDTRCTRCGRITDQRNSDLPELPSCHVCGGLLRPAVVWFGEQLPKRILKKAQAAVDIADVFINIGTSGAVYPAAGFAADAQERGATVIEINPDQTELSHRANISLRGTATALVPLLFERAAKT